MTSYQNAEVQSLARTLMFSSFVEYLNIFSYSLIFKLVFHCCVCHVIKVIV